MSYRETKLAKARANAQELTHDPTLDAIYLAGSFTADLGSPSSDVDVFVITHDSHGSPPRQVVVGEERLDIETYPVSWYQDVLRRLSEWRSRAMTCGQRR